MNCVIAAVVLSLVVSAGVGGQSSVETTEIQGRVFAIARNGDLLPARMANVYVLKCGEQDDACDRLRKGMANGKCEKMDVSGGSALKCATGVLQDTVNWVRQNNAAGRLAVGVNADEEGNFKADITGLTGEGLSVAVLIVATGKSGGQPCYWWYRAEAKKGTTNTVVKLSQVAFYKYK